MADFVAGTGVGDYDRIGCSCPATPVVGAVLVMVVADCRAGRDGVDRRRHRDAIAARVRSAWLIGRDVGGVRQRAGRRTG